MKYIAHIEVMPLKELLDPQGKAVNEALHNLGMNGIENVRIGKSIHLTLEAGSEEEAKTIATAACEKMLYNAVMEYFEVKISAA